MKFINRFLRNLAPYSVASHLIWEVDEYQRDQILKLDWNEATIKPSPKVSEAIKKLVQNDNFYNLYPSTHNDEIIKRLAEYCQVSRDCVQYFSSSDSLHEYLVRMYVSVGDPILILGPTYDNFRLTCEAQGGRIINFEYSQNFELDKNAFIDAIRDNSPTLIYICNPNNPTGNVVDGSFIKELVERFENTAFLIDEAYFEFCGTTCKDLIEEYENVFISRTFSKAFALANFRAGYLLSQKGNIHQVSKIRNPKNLSTFTQVAIIAALRDIDYMKAFVKEVKLAREYFSRELSTLPFVDRVFKGEGNFVLVRFKSGEAKQFVLSELAKSNIFVRNLTHREILKNCLRITIGTQEQMKRVVLVLKSLQQK